MTVRGFDEKTASGAASTRRRRGGPGDPAETLDAASADRSPRTFELPPLGTRP